MTARRPNAGAALADLAFAVLAFASGWAGAPIAFAGLVFLGAATVWGWTRREVLGRMSPSQRWGSGAMALAIIAVVLGVSYWLGLQVRGPE